MKTPLALLAVLLGAAPALAQTVVLTDPAGDDHGPGTYAAPASEGFRPGSFDLVEVRVEATPSGVDLRVTFAGAPQTVLVRPSIDAPPVPVFMPVVDLYMAVNPAPGSGHRELLPGRRVTTAGDFGWDRAVVVGAMPARLEGHYRTVAPALAADTCFARSPRLDGRTLSVHLPRRCFPQDVAKAGYLVVVTGLGPGAGMANLVRRTLERPRPDAEDPLVRTVGPTVGACNVWEDGAGASPCTFGGCTRCEWHPFVLDAIVPPGADQRALLSAYDAPHRRLAALPFVFPAGGPAAAAVAPPPPDPRLAVVASRGGELTVKAPDPLPSACSVGSLGAIICPGERPGGTVVVKGVAAGFLVLEKVGDTTPVCEGASVVF